LLVAANASAAARRHRAAFSTATASAGGVGRVLASRDRHAAFRTRRVIIKTRLIKMTGRSLNGARVHLRYLQRDGVTRERLPGDLYHAKLDRADGAAFLERSEGDRHQFRFIVSPEDAIEYQELKDFTRRLMRRMAEDLDTELDWVAVDDYNTGHPHSHIVLRGKDERGADLIIAREYLSQGMRERAAEIVTLDLGPRTDREIETRLRAEVEQERFTSIDRAAGSRGGDGDRALSRATPSARRSGRAACRSCGAWALPRPRRGNGSSPRTSSPCSAAWASAASSSRPCTATWPAKGWCAAPPISPSTTRPNRRRSGWSAASWRGGSRTSSTTATTSSSMGLMVAPTMLTPAEPMRRSLWPRAASCQSSRDRWNRDRPTATVAEIAAAHGGRYSLDIHLNHDPKP
jgi:hypothetical protein